MNALLKIIVPETHMVREAQRTNSLRKNPDMPRVPWSRLTAGYELTCEV